jgi:hypothetical protein
MKREVRELFENRTETSLDVVQEEHIRGLPEPVQRHLRYAGIVGRERVDAVRLKQKGFIRLGEERGWMPFTARQYYTTDPPAFIWRGNVKLGPLTAVAATDRYSRGKGNMRVKLLSLLKIAEAGGFEMDQGALARYMNEAMWFPAAYLKEYIQWEPLDGDSARATMSYQGVSASAVLHFGAGGELTNFVAERYYRRADGQYTLETWSTPLTEYGEIGGVRVPTRGTGVWSLSSGDYEYIRIGITDIEYNNPVPY